MHFNTVRLATLVSLLFIGLLSAHAEEAPVARATNKALVAEWLADYRAEQADNPDVMFRDGVVANRQTRRVEAKKPGCLVRSSSAA